MRTFLNRPEKTVFELVIDMNRAATENKPFKVKGADLTKLALHINDLTDEVVKLRFHQRYKGRR